MTDLTTDLRRVAVEKVRHYSANFTSLEERFKGKYPRMFVSGHGVYLIDTAVN